MQDGNHTADETLMADILNNFFASIFTVENDTISQPVPQNQNNGAYFNTCVFHKKDILLAISNIKINKTPGPEKISPRLLKEAKNEIAKSLSILFNKSQFQK